MARPYYRIGRLILVTVALGVVSQPHTANACRLWDWLLRRDSNTTATTALYPGVTALSPAATCGQATCEQTVVRYVPQVTYRTVWQPVPVTTYRRTVSYNPATGLPITCTQPCTTYTYQARRVPQTSYRPVLTNVPLRGDACAVASAPAATSSAACGCDSTSGQAPYYSAPVAPSTPGASSSGATDGAGATPWEPVGPNAAGGEPHPASPESSATDPANERPRLDPDVNTSSYRATPQAAADRQAPSWPSERRAGQRPVTPPRPSQVRPLPDRQRQPWQSTPRWDEGSGDRTASTRLPTISSLPTTRLAAASRPNGSPSQLASTPSPRLSVSDRSTVATSGRTRFTSDDRPSRRTTSGAGVDRWRSAAR